MLVGQMNEKKPGNWKFPVMDGAMKDFSERYRLTQRESEIFALILTDGCTNREIAERCAIAEKTVKIHISNMMKKADIGSIRKLFSLFFMTMNSSLIHAGGLEREP